MYGNNKFQAEIECAKAGNSYKTEVFSEKPTQVYGRAI